MMKNLKIGNLHLKHRTILAPMASLTDIVFRRVVDEIGGIGLMVTELISAEGLRRKHKRKILGSGLEI
jgi:tRNA-dihydrouridine synthase B